MYIVGVRNNKADNFKIIFTTKFKKIAKIFSKVIKVFFNETEVQNTKNIYIIED